ncbi:MAG: hypothetical protein JO264_09005 [Acidisphaera sp.]|nr:hypothetical protein [Acidisphaera sp.]
MANSDPTDSFFLIVADLDAGLFSVEGPMTDDRAWHRAAQRAKEKRSRRIQSGPSGSDRDALAREFQETRQFRGVPPGSIVRPVHE